MQWSEIRRHHPNQWLLLEALEAHTEGTQRILDQLAIIRSFDDSQTALRSYAELRRSAPERELYVFHTSRSTLDVQERSWLGIRSGRCWPAWRPRPCAPACTP